MTDHAPFSVTTEEEQAMNIDKLTPLPWDAADSLTSEEAIAAYLAEFADDTDPVLLAQVQDDVARARARIAAAAERGKQ